MKNERLEELLAQALPILSEYWEECLAAGLDGHTRAAHDAVDGLIVQYFEALKALPETASRADILEVMKRLFASLDQLNGSLDGTLLETDERELLVPIVISAAEASGLSIREFPNGDPTFDFRNF